MHNQPATNTLAAHPSNLSQPISTQHSQAALMSAKASWRASASAIPPPTYSLVISNTAVSRRSLAFFLPHSEVPIHQDEFPVVLLEGNLCRSSCCPVIRSVESICNVASSFQAPVDSAVDARRASPRCSAFFDDLRHPVSPYIAATHTRLGNPVLPGARCGRCSHFLRNCRPLCTVVILV